MVHYSTVQYSTVQYSTVQYSTVQYSTVQYSTVQYQQRWDTNVKYNYKLNKTGVPQNAPAGSWRAGMQ